MRFGGKDAHGAQGERWEDERLETVTATLIARNPCCHWREHVPSVFVRDSLPN